MTAPPASPAIQNYYDRTLEPILPNDQANFYEALRASASSLEPIIQEYQITTTSGEVNWVRNSARYSLMDNGDVIVDGVVIDISDCLRHSFGFTHCGPGAFTMLRTSARGFCQKHQY